MRQEHPAQHPGRIRRAERRTGRFVGDEPIRAPNIDRGMVFQDYALFPWLSVLENVEFGLERKGIRKRERRDIALDYLGTVGLGDFATKRTHELSGGHEATGGDRARVRDRTLDHSHGRALRGP